MTIRLSINWADHDVEAAPDTALFVCVAKRSWLEQTEVRLQTGPMRRLHRHH